MTANTGRYTIALSLFIVASCSGFNNQALSQENTVAARQVFLLIGQSNMAGRAQFAAQDTAVINQVWILNDQLQWEPAKNPLNRYSSVRKSLSMQKLGPGYTFATTLIESNPELEIGLVVNARGGTSIRSWLPDSLLYRESVTRTKIALTTGGSLNAVIWHQGGSDRNNYWGYYSQLETIIAALRNDFANPELPFIVGQIGDFRSNGDSLNTILMRIPQQIAYTECVSDSGLTHLGDETHFNRISQLELGRRYALAADRMIYHQPANLDTRN